MAHKGLILAVALWIGSVGAVAAQLQHPTLLRNHPAIRYDSTPSNDAVCVIPAAVTFVIETTIS